MQQGIIIPCKNFSPRVPYHPRNLDPPLPACYLPAEAFLFWHLNGGRERQGNLFRR